MPATVKQTVIDRGWNRIKKEMRKADNSFTEIGLPKNGKVDEGKGGGSGHKKIVEMSELLIVGAVNEYGAPNRNIPARPFIRTTFDENRQKINRLVVNEYEKIIDGTSNVKRSLGLIGEWLTAKTIAKIRAIRTPPNAPSTIAKKKSSNPLVDMSQMVQSIQHVETIK